MTDRRNERRGGVTRGQSAGCLAIAVFAAVLAAVCLVLGFRCVMTTDTFNCFGLLTVFPAALLAVALVAAVVGFRRFVSPEQQGKAAPRPLGFGEGWQPVEPARPAEGSVAGGKDVIYLPGRGAEPAGRSPLPPKQAKPGEEGVGKGGLPGPGSDRDDQAT